MPATAPPGTPGWPDASDAPTTPGTPDTPGSDSPEPWLKTLQAMLRDLPGLVTGRVELLTLEVERAAQALAQIVLLVVAAAILGVTLWLVLWAGIVAALLAWGLSWAAALSLVLGVNLIAAWLAVARVRRLLPRLTLSATRRHLLPSPSPQPRNPPPSHPSAPAHERPDITRASQPAAR